ncbi:FtsW/RodA/SpoVE family cell cycle protein [Bacteroidales bacterium OttesenSCG-928-B11]|nr:FtsW/RodA/SpoVE family cell cycle protein [Bacteroidales bacterium OttesenSCG-928-C03]MDL2311610.1 FtsW/RodA/SpoVE family cell cycle protein [Bacteroidales bacterium OttesenSCG-928-B11]MDL2326663.1 FtsW/RodA/SpoVE family cell cycle protein [Bacteroidales bacterium OttesenSCG-928-A14]
MEKVSRLNTYFRGDKVILIIAVILSLISFYIVPSSTHRFGSQMIHILACYGAMILFYKIDYRTLSAGSDLLLIFAFVLAILTVFVGTDDRSVTIGGFSMQTFYFIGFLLIFFISKFIAIRLNKGEELSTKETLILFGIIGIFCLLFAKSNLSTAIILGVSCFAILFIGNLDRKYLFGFIAMAMVVGVIYFGFGLGKSDTGISRVSNFSASRNFDQVPDRETSLYIKQMVLAQAAIARSAWTPAGPGQGEIKNVLAEKETDYVYATVVEEVGIVVGGLIILLYLILFFRAMRVARLSEGYFGRLLAIGIGFWITFQALIHIGVNCAAIPATGQTLPLISRGGSSLLFSGIMFGMLLNISKNTENEKYSF